MKKITKICAVLAASVAAIAFTGCPDAADILKSFGKDDLYGTWMTLEFDNNGNRKDYYINTSNNDPYVVTWKFDGKSENMFNGNGGNFWQHLVHYTSVTDNGNGTYTFGTKDKETFWYGEYAIKGNSGYSKGKLYLYYECGYELYADGVQNSVSLDTLKTWKTSDFLSAAGLTGLTDEKLINNIQTDTTTHNKYYKNNNVTIQIREVDGNKQCSDIEYFRFNLKDGSSSGYTRLMATVVDKTGSGNIGGIYDQWATTNYDSFTGQYQGGYKVHGSSSWSGQTTRYMGRISVSSTPQNPRWLYSNTKTNDQLFKVNGQLISENDSTNYEDPNAEVDARAEE
ncbi:MAG: hypothetical protein J5857_06295 [Treponema sp.]|nr:hypothetical protein [Treponema sp.]